MKIHLLDAKKQLEQKIAELQQQIDDLDKESIEAKLAIILHNNRCRANHMDQCYWDYEIKNNKHSWEQPSHQTWLKKATNLYNTLKEETGVSDEDLVTIIDRSTSTLG